MVECELRDLLTMQLTVGEDFLDAPEVPSAVAIPGLGEALDLGEGSLTDRVALLSALDDLRREGLVVEDERRVVGTEGERRVYFLTEEGRARARVLRDRYADETVVVHDGEDTTELRLADADRYFPEPAIPRALARLTADGELYLHREVGERFVNREAALERLTDLLAHVEDGASEAVLVAGEAGIGKTTLVVDEFADVARDRGGTMLVGRCQRDTSSAYGPFRSALSQYLDGEDPFHGPGEEPDDAEHYEGERAAMFETVRRLVDDVAVEEGPLVFVVDDLHSAADPTVDLFVHLADRLDGRVLLVGTYRPEDLPEDHPVAVLSDRWTVGPDEHVHLDLDPFDRAETRDLVAWLVQHRGVPAEVIDLLYDRTGGNPLFIAESVRRLRDRGAFDVEHEVYPSAEGELPLPDRVEDALELRLDALDGSTRAVLEAGAIVGQTVPVDVLEAVVPAEMTEAELRECVDLLVGARVWEWARQGRRLRFASGLVRETVVDRLGEERARELHRRTADAVASRTGADPDHHATAAYHYRMAGRNEASFQHYRVAADHAKDVYAHEVARDCYLHAYDLATESLELAETDARVVDLLENVAEVYYLLGDYEEADRYYGFADERTDDPERGRRIARVRADMIGSRGQTERALEICEEALEVYGAADTYETAILLGRKGAEHSHLGDLAAAEKEYERVLEIANRIDDDDARAAGLLDFGALDMARGDVDEGTVERLEAAVEAAERGDNDRTVARALNNLAMAHMERGRLGAAEETFRRVLEIHERMGDLVRLAESRRNLASIYQNRGDLDAALSTYDEALETAERARTPNVMATIHLSASSIHHLRGELDAARQHMERALALQKRVGDPRAVATTSAYLADVHADMGELERASELIEEATEMAAELEAPAIEGLAAIVRGDVLLQRGDVDGALRANERGLELADAVETAFDSPQEVYARYGLVEAALERGDVETASEQAATAFEVATGYDNPALVAAARLYRGICRRHRGEYEGATEDLEAALATVREPETRSVITECQALLELGRLERDRGNDAAAARHAAGALELVTDHDIGRYEAAAHALEEDVG